MLCLKKVYSEDLLQLALLLSLLRTQSVDWEGGAPLISVGDSSLERWGSVIPRTHPKCMDSYLLDYQEQVLRDLNYLGRFSHLSYQNVTAYIGITTNNEPSTSASSPDPEDTDDDDLYPPYNREFDDSELTQEDMDLIEVLWKQDVDMGFSLEEFQEAASGSFEDSDLKQSKLIQQAKKVDDLEEDPWAGLSYTIDLETGEYILKEDCEPGELCEDEPPSALLGQSDFSLEEALQLVGLNEDTFEGGEQRAESEREATTETEEKQDEARGSPLTEISLEDELDLLADMIQAPNYHHHHHHPPARPFQGRMAYMRSVSSEQRWQELAGLFSLPADHYHYHPPPPAAYHHPAHPPPDKIHHHHVPPDPYLGPGPGSMSGANNLGSAVASSMNLMTNSSEPMGGEASAASFKMENQPDMMYYQNGTGEIGQNNADGFLSSILNDEDLQLMDMAMNEGMYTMRMLEGGTDSDSAVSSMGSERVPSLTSDTDWMETNSDSGHTPADHFMTDYHSKYRWYDYGYTRQHSGESASSSGHRMPPVAQKKHHLYGKRMFHEQQNNAGNLSPVLPHNSPPCAGSNNVPLKFELRGADPPGGNNQGGIAFGPPPLDMVKGHHPEIKYSCSIEFTRQNLGAGARSSPSEAAIHNHTYHMPPEQSGSQARPFTRDKKIKRTDEDGGGGVHLSRDERRARSLSIPLSVDDIINLPMDEFNERLSKFDLSESQLSLIRDIRRRGKNKVAAQNCRKRKLDQILSLADEVKQMREKKQRLLQEREQLLTERHRVKTKFTQLYRHIFQSLRDSDGNTYSPYEWSLQQSADGSVVLVPRNGNQTMLDP